MRGGASAGDFMRLIVVSGLVFWLAGSVSSQTETRARERQPGAVVLSEVNYHPESGDAAEEWIELHHAGDAPLDLGGWQLAGDVRFAFPRSTPVAPGAFLIVCGDAERIRSSIAPDSDNGRGIFGNWTGRLGRRKGVIRLLDAAGSEVDALEYADRAPFPELPDGHGHSLERRSPRAPTRDPANWGASTGAPSQSGEQRTWRRVVARGVATSSRLYFYLTEAGIARIDDLSLRLASGGPNLVVGGDFEDRGPWVFTGNHGRSQITAELPRSGNGCLIVRAGGPGGSSGSSVMHQQLRVAPGQEHVLEFWIRFDGPPVGFVARLSGAREGNGIYVESGASRQGSTPGLPNSLDAAALPPFIHPVSHRPSEPGPLQKVLIDARLLASSPPKAVRVHFDAGDGELTAPLRSTRPGASRSAGLIDAIYSAELGPFAAGTLVRYRVEAEDANGSIGRYPFEGSPTSQLGFLVTDAAEARSELPTYYLYLPPASQNAINTNPYSDSYQPATLVHDGLASCDVGVRRRGHTSRGLPEHHWKIRFNNDHAYRSPTSGFRKARSINLNSAYGDRVFLREPLAYGLWRDLGEPYSETSFVRLFVNGEFHGLYVQVENPGDDYLGRNQLEEGWLWKAYHGGHGEGRLPMGALRSSPGLFQRLFGGGRADDGPADLTRSTRFGGIQGFELKAGDPQSGAAALEGFLRQINELRGEELEAYIHEHMDVESMVNFLAASQVVHSADHIEKNYLVYADPAGRFTLLPWDLDLTHGRNFEPRGGIYNDFIRWDMWDAEYGDEKLLFGTLAHPKIDGPWNAVINAFLGKTTAFRKQYYERIAYCLRHYYHPDILIPRAERIRELIRADAQRDRRHWSRYLPGDTDFDRQFAVFPDWIRKRYAHLSGKLTALGYPVGNPLSASFEVDRPRGEAPLEVRFENFSVGEIERVSWDFGDGARSGERAPAHVYEKPGRYDVSLEVTGPGGAHRSLRRECVYVEEAEAE